MPKLLKALVLCYKDNKDKKKQGYRYKDELLKNFAIFSRDLGGRQVYEFWQKNLPLPNLSTVAGYSGTSSQPLIEGSFRFDELSQFLEERNLEKYIWKSEDGTRLVSRVQYDPSTNQLLGLVPAIDGKGCPKVSSFDASTSDKIVEMFKTQPCSNYAYVLMVQPLADVPPFCLSIYGTNNKFTSCQVLNRWRWTVDELWKRGITLMGVSSDGDTRLLSAMKTLTFGKAGSVLPGWEDFFFAPMEVHITPLNVKAIRLKPVCIQDCIHTLAKLKSQLLKDRSDDNFLPVGEYTITGTFLHIVLAEISKFEHGLTLTDLDGKDKMNFRAVQKILDDRVINALDKVPEAIGTKKFLINVKGFMDCFYDRSLKDTEKVYLLWRCIFFFRFWRRWLKLNGFKSKNFITSNTYHCMEVTAHSFINIIRWLRILDKPHLFLPHVMNSQSNERFFGNARSISSALSTVVNMTMLDFLHRARKIERIADVGHKLSEEINIPRHHKKMLESVKTLEILEEQGLSSDEALLAAIRKAEKDAFTMANEVNMKFDSVPKIQPQDLGMLVTGAQQDEDTGDEENEDEEMDCDAPDIELTGEMPDEVSEDIVVASEVPEVISPNSVFTKYCIDGKEQVIRKSTLIWLLTTKKYSLSSDRSIRVKAAEERLQNHELSSPVSKVAVEEELCLGDWCVFKNTPQPKHFFVGRILSFAYLSGAGESKSYSKMSVPTSPPEGEARGVGCLGSWFVVAYEGDGQLQPYKQACHSYLDIDRYKCTLPRPQVHGSRLQYSPEVICAVQKLLKWRSSKRIAPKDQHAECAQPKRFRTTADKPQDGTGACSSQIQGQRRTVKSSKQESKKSEEDIELTDENSEEDSGEEDKMSIHSDNSCEGEGWGEEEDSESESPFIPDPSEKLPLSKNIEEGDFVLVMLMPKVPSKASKLVNKPKYYVAKVISEEDEDGDYEVSFLRQSSKCQGKFVMPPAPDLSSIHKSDIHMILPKPSVSGTKRQQDQLGFSTDLSLFTLG